MFKIHLTSTGTFHFGTNKFFQDDNLFKGTVTDEFRGVFFFVFLILHNSEEKITTFLPTGKALGGKIALGTYT